jgi:hypothetical protein
MKLKEWKMDLSIVSAENGDKITASFYPPARCAYHDGTYMTFEPTGEKYRDPTMPPESVLREVQELMNALSETASTLGVHPTIDWTVRDLVQKLTAQAKAKMWQPSKRKVCPTCGRELP